MDDYFSMRIQKMNEHQYFKDRGKIIIFCKEDEFYRKKKNCISRYLKFDLETKS